MKEITGMQVKDYIRENLPRTVRHIVRDEDTLFGLPYPYTVPCADGMFNELYYWDTYFTNKALLVLGQAEQAANNTKDILYLIDRFGYMPNGNRTGFCGAVSRRMPRLWSTTCIGRAVICRFSNLRSLRSKKYEFWMTRRVSENGLNHYDCEEDEESCAAMYNGCVAARIGKDDSRDPKEAGRHYFAECESGWDFNPRFDGYCAHCNP